MSEPHEWDEPTWRGLVNQIRAGRSLNQDEMNALLPMLTARGQATGSGIEARVQSLEAAVQHLQEQHDAEQHHRDFGVDRCLAGGGFLHRALHLVPVAGRG